MDKNDVRRLKALLGVAEADLAAVKSMLKTPAELNHERFKCHVRHMLEIGGELLVMFDDSEDENQLVIDLEPATNGTQGGAG